MKKKIIPIVVTVVVLGVLIPVLILTLKPGTESVSSQLIKEVFVLVKDAYGDEAEWFLPGEQWRIIKGGDIIAEISATHERATIRTEDGEYYLSFATGDTSWSRIISGYSITVNIKSKVHTTSVGDPPPIVGLRTGLSWIELSQSEKHDGVQEILDYWSEFTTGKSKSVGEIVTMLDTFYDDTTNLQMSVYDALEELLLN